MLFGYVRGEYTKGSFCSMSLRLPETSSLAFEATASALWCARAMPFEGKGIASLSKFEVLEAGKREVFVDSVGELEDIMADGSTDAI